MHNRRFEVTPHTTTPPAPEILSLEQIKTELVARIQEIQRSGDQIGEGRTAEVFVSSLDSRICYKIIRTDFEGFRVKSDLEGELLGELCGLDSRVKVPMPYYSISTEDGFEVLVMERLQAVSLDDVIMGRANLPIAFEMDGFFRKIEVFFEKMHEDRHIYHRDIHSGNIMATLNDASPCVIDLGVGIKLYGNSENPYLQRDIRGNVRRATPDEVRLKEVKLALKRYLASIPR